MGLWLCLASLAGAGDAGEGQLVRVRLLAREHPTQLRVESPAEVRCDGAPEGNAGQLAFSAGRVRLGGKDCLRVDAEAPWLTVGETRRHYSGSVAIQADGGELRVIETVDREAYLAAVLAQEADALSGSALRAQAIVSRTFSYAEAGRHHAGGYDFCDLTHCQLYRGDEAVPRPVGEAVAATRGQVLVSVAGGAMVPAYFHAACGGGTSSSLDAFGVAGTRSVRDVDEKGAPLCAAAPGFEWSFRIKRDELAHALALRADEHLSIERRDLAGHVLSMKAGARRVSGVDFVSAVGKQLGYQSVRGTRFSIEEQGAWVRFVGRGLGHGVGFCQYGANALAAKGRSVDEILAHYFPGARIAPVP